MGQTNAGTFLRYIFRTWPVWVKWTTLKSRSCEIQNNLTCIIKINRTILCTRYRSLSVVFWLLLLTEHIALWRPYQILHFDNPLPLLTTPTWTWPREGAKKHDAWEKTALLRRFCRSAMKKLAIAVPRHWRAWTNLPWVSEAAKVSQSRATRAREHRRIVLFKWKRKRSSSKCNSFGTN